jgi:hypothetical protein
MSRFLAGILTRVRVPLVDPIHPQMQASASACALPVMLPSIA